MSPFVVRFNGQVGLVVVAVGLLAVAPTANAADINWRRPEGGTFSSAGSWFGGVVPGTGDNAIFGLSTSGPLGTLPPYTVSFTALASNDSLRIQDDSVVFDLNGLVYETLNTSFGMVLGSVSGKTGQLTVTDGIVTLPFQSDLEIASIAGAGGSLVVGAGGKVIGTMDVLVGLNGNGALNINSNGDVIANDVTLGSSSTVTGTATITGGGSSLLADELVVGSNGTGVLNINASGRVDSTDGILGDAAGSSGAATISGANSLWQLSDQLWVGFSGEGTLRIEAGGTVRDKDGLVKGSAVVTGGSNWINQFTLNVGMTSASPGNLTIESGSHVQSGNSNLAIANGGKAFALVRDNGTTWTNAGVLNVGLAGEGELTIEFGAAVTSVGGGIAATGGSKGTARINDSTSSWTTRGNFIVGEAGDGQLEITAGQLLFTGESDLIVGDGASGRMLISAGGKALDAFETVVGNLSGSTGELAVTGPSSQLRSLDRLTVGGNGRGTLLVANGGRVSNDVGIIGSNSSVRVQGNNSTWTNGDVLNLFDNAALVIEDGGAVSSVGSVISGATGAASVVTVSNGTWANSGSLSVGSSGAGSLTIEAGGRVDSHMSDIGVLSSSTGSVTVAGAGSTWTIAGNLRVGGDGINNGGVGTLRIQAGSTAVVLGGTKIHKDDLLVLEGGTLSTVLVDFVQGQGTFQWTSGTLHLAQYDGNLLVPGGGVFSPGTIAVPSSHATVFGGYTQRAGATLEIDNLSDFVNITDTAVLGGTLALNLNGDVPNPTTNYTIFDALSISGSFANVANGQRFTTTDGLGSFVVNYGAGSAFNPNQIVLSSFLASAGVPGDYNQNGIVDAADYTRWRNNLGSGTSLPNDDTPGVGPEDYTRWRTHFGQTAGSGGALPSYAVPETTAPSLLLLTAVCMSCVRSSKRRLVFTLVRA